VREGWEFSQLELIVAGNVVGLTHRGKGLGLLDGVDPEIGFEIELQIEHVGRVSGLLGDDGQDLLGHGVARRR
jgi:hypothetical protein